jgi:hypothetical protein
MIIYSPYQPLAILFKLIQLRPNSDCHDRYNQPLNFIETDTQKVEIVLFHIPPQ